MVHNQLLSGKKDDWRTTDDGLDRRGTCPPGGESARCATRRALLGCGHCIHGSPAEAEYLG